MVLLYINAQLTLIFSITFVGVAPYFILNKQSVIIGNLSIFCSLAMNVDFCMNIIELWLRMRHAMKEMRQIRHQKRFMCQLRTLYGFTLIFNLYIYTMCYWYTSKIISDVKDIEHELIHTLHFDDTQLNYNLNRENNFFTGVEGSIAILSVISVIVIVMMLR